MSGYLLTAATGSEEHKDKCPPREEKKGNKIHIDDCMLDSKKIYSDQ